jgi:hypothetical protein
LPPEPDDLGMSLGIAGVNSSGRSPSRLPLSRSPGAARCRKQNPRYAFVRRRLLTHVLALGYALDRARPRRITGCFVPGSAAGALDGAGVRPLGPLAPDAPGQALCPVFLLAAYEPGGLARWSGRQSAAALRSSRHAAALLMGSRLRRSPTLVRCRSPTVT